LWIGKFFRGSLSSHKEELPIFAGAIIEYSKALETAVNEMVLAPFVDATFGQFAEAFIKLPSAQHKRNVVQLKFQGRPERPSLGALRLVLQSDDSEWCKFCMSSFGPRAGWIRTELPNILKCVLDFRNGCAHSTSGTRAKAVALRKYLNSSGVFAKLEEITGATPESPPVTLR
jgi:hypothetical protein